MLNLFFCQMTKIDLQKLVNHQHYWNHVSDNSFSSIKTIFHHFFPTHSFNSADYDRFQLIGEEMGKNQMFATTYLDSDYPQSLRQIPDPPRVIYYKGNYELLKKERIIAIVGTRKSSTYGQIACQQLTKKLVEHQFITVSGMAMGIDAIAHKQTLQSNGNTVCVLGSSVHNPTPRSNKKLYYDILERNGLILSEYHPLTKVYPSHFALRNRIVSGISDGVLIIEAGAKSGTLITAEYALNQGKTVFAVPGNINQRNSIGTNQLIKQGAVCCTSIEDIMDEFHLSYQQHIKMVTTKIVLSDIEQTILSLMDQNGIMHHEQISGQLQMNIQDVSGVLSILDLKGLVSFDGSMVQKI